MKHSRKFMLGVSSAAVALSMAPAAAYAQDDDTEEVIEEVYITGSRRALRSATDTPAPVDVISASDIQNQGNGDLSNLLRTVVPSYNVNSQPINDASTLIRPANLRGLASDQVLVLTNNKRRHRAAVITFLGNGVSDGAQGPDISAIPAIALKSVEVLRDGAAAQYGSDAIAGVINFKLNDSNEGGSLEAKYGSSFEGDGDAYQIMGNIGLPVTDDGFVNISMEYRDQKATSRSIQRNDAEDLINAGNSAVPDPAQIWGAPKISGDFKAFVNFAVQASDVAEIYAFGNYSERTVRGGFYYRNPTTRGSVFSNDGGVTRLVGDLTPNDGMDCQGGLDFAAGNGDMITSPLLVGDDAGLAAVMADPNCWVFNSMFPGGFTPNFGGDLNDIAGVMGVRGEFDNGLTYDVSAAAGRNEVVYMIFNTVNASLGPDTPNDFNPGTYIQLEKNFNADFTYPWEVGGLASPVNVAFGLEYREEQFEVKAGDPESFQPGPLFMQGFSIGSNGFGGFGPEVAGVWDRTNFAAYLDLEADMTDELVMSAAIRFEDFSDFGSTTNFKIGAMYRVTDEFNIRGGFNTGFRAPTPGQSNVSNVTTAFENGALTNRATIPPTNPVSLAFGGKQLQPESSDSFTAGFVYDGEIGTLTVDYFNIKVSDRIAQIDSIVLTAADIDALLASGITDAGNLGSFRYFANDFDTRTQGVDVVFSIPLDLTDNGSTEVNFAGNYTKTKVLDASTNVGSIRRDLLENSLPKYRGNVSLTHSEENWRGSLRANYFGKYREYFAGELPMEGGAEITLDVEAGYNVQENVEFIVGVDNLFNNFPDRNPWGRAELNPADMDFGVSLGALYGEAAPMGMMGGFYYAKIRYTF